MTKTVADRLQKIREDIAEQSGYRNAYQDFSDILEALDAIIVDLRSSVEPSTVQRELCPKHGTPLSGLATGR